MSSSKKAENDDCECLYCGGLYSESTEDFIQCQGGCTDIDVSTVVSLRDRMLDGFHGSKLTTDFSANRLRHISDFLLNMW